MVNEKLLRDAKPETYGSEACEGAEGGLTASDCRLITLNAGAAAAAAAGDGQMS